MTALSGEHLKILLIGNSVADRSRSMLRFGELLETSLRRAGIQVTLLHPPDFFSKFFKRDGPLRKWTGYIDKYLIFPFILVSRASEYDLVHICDHSNSVYLRFLENVPHAITCHDLMAVKSGRGMISENRTGWTGRILQRAILDGLRRAQFVICVSKRTQSDVVQIAGRSEATTSIINSSLNYCYRPLSRANSKEILKRLVLSVDSPYLLHVGGNQWYKNRLGVLQIYECLRRCPEGSPYRMVMAGQPFTNKMREFIKSHQLQADVIELSDVSNEELCALYSAAEALVFPSLDEGFGWPIIEAQACGCPVFVTGRQPMTEVGGPAAIYFNPLDSDMASNVILDGLRRRPELIAAGFANAKRFEEERFLRQHVETYRMLLRSTVL